jgi:hypothetical protein
MAVKAVPTRKRELFCVPAAQYPSLRGRACAGSNLRIWLIHVMIAAFFLDNSEGGAQA